MILPSLHVGPSISKCGKLLAVKSKERLEDLETMINVLVLFSLTVTYASQVASLESFSNGMEVQYLRRSNTTPSLSMLFILKVTSSTLEVETARSSKWINQAMLQPRLGTFLVLLAHKNLLAPQLELFLSRIVSSSSEPLVMRSTLKKKGSNSSSSLQVTTLLKVSQETMKLGECALLKPPIFLMLSLAVRMEPSDYLIKSTTRSLCVSI
jgi:hypothetical protein